MTRRTIHDMTDGDVKEDLRKAFQYVPEHQSITEACTAVARRLAGPDPRPLVEASKIAVQYLEDSAMTKAGSSNRGSQKGATQYWNVADQARKALAAWENGQ